MSKDAPRSCVLRHARSRGLLSMREQEVPNGLQEAQPDWNAASVVVPARADALQKRSNSTFLQHRRGDWSPCHDCGRIHFAELGEELLNTTVWRRVLRPTTLFMS